MSKIFLNLKISNKIAIAFICIVLTIFLAAIYFSFLTIRVFRESEALLQIIKNEINSIYGATTEFNYIIYEAPAARAYYVFVNLAVVSSIVVIVTIIAWRILSKNISAPIFKITEVINSISVGNLNVEIPEQGNNELGTLAKAAKNLKEDLENLIDDIKTVKEEVIVYGNIDYRLKEASYQGSYREMVRAINEYKESFILDIIEVINTTNNIQDGNFKTNVKDYPGKKIILTTALNSLINNLKDISEEIENIMSGETEEIDTKKYSGEWQRMMIQLNALIKTNIPFIAG